jgi:hypothetical protein
MSAGRAAEIVDDILARASEAIEASRQETADLPEALLEVVKGQLVGLEGAGVLYQVSPLRRNNPARRDA